MSFPTFDVNNNRTDVIEPGELHIQHGDIQMHMSNNNNYAAVELGGSSGAYVDFKAPYTDNYDFRLIGNNNNFSLYGRESDSSAPHLFLTCDKDKNTIGIGTNASADAVLDVSGNVIISGNVGIGTTDPTEELDVSGNIRCFNSIDGGGVIFKGDADYTNLIGERHVYIKANGKDQSGVAQNDGQIIFVPGTGAGEKVRINKDGNLGIGTDNPSEALDVNGSIRIRKGNNLFIGDDIWDSLRFQHSVSGSGSTGYNYIDYNNNSSISFRVTTGPASSSSVSNTMTLDKDGNVGIGTANPQVQLHVNDIVRSYIFQVYNDDYRMETQNAQLAFRSTGGNGIGFYTTAEKTIPHTSTIDNSIDDAKMIIKNYTVSGATQTRVGIGLTNPSNILTIFGTHDDIGPILGLRSGNGNTTINNGAQIAFGFHGNAEYQHFIHTRHNADVSHNAIDFYVCDGTQNNTVTAGSTHTMSLVSGYVGIGITAPDFPLHVKAGDNYNLTGGYYFSAGHSLAEYAYLRKYGSSGTAIDNSILADGGVTGTAFYADSDSRIKTNILDINDESALTKLREIEPKTYQYIDTIKRDNVTVYGFIAQQIKEVLPKAVTFQNRTIPSIFELCNATSSSNNDYYDTIHFTDFNTANLDASSNNLVIVDANNKNQSVNITAVLDSSSVQVDTDLSEWMGSVDASNETVIPNEVQKYKKVILDASNNVVLENYDIAPIASMDASGNVVGKMADLTGENTIDSSNNYVDASGSFIAAVNSDGHYIDASGNYFDTNGNFMDASNNLVGTYKTEWKKVTINGTKIFVYGQNVNDFHVLQKEYIFTVATAALQEVDRQLQAEKAKTATLESQVADLLARVSALESA